MCLNFCVFTVLWKCSELLCTCPSELWTWIIVFFFETVNYCLLLLSAIYVWEKQPSLMCWRAGSILSHWIWFGGMDGGGKLRCDLLKASHWIPVHADGRGECRLCPGLKKKSTRWIVALSSYLLILSNRGPTKLKRFISWFSTKLCN